MRVGSSRFWTGMLLISDSERSLRSQIVYYNIHSIKEKANHYSIAIIGWLCAVLTLMQLRSSICWYWAIVLMTVSLNIHLCSRKLMNNHSFTVQKTKRHIHFNRAKSVAWVDSVVLSLYNIAALCLLIGPGILCVMYGISDFLYHRYTSSTTLHALSMT